MTGNSGADPGTGAAVSQTPPPASDPYADLLCTICGLTACWKKPADSPEPAGAADAAASASE
jgi:hypothetical protein